MRPPRFFTLTVAILAVAFAAAPWLFLAMPPWAASLCWATTAACAALAYLAERRRLTRRLEADALRQARDLEVALQRQAELAQELSELKATSTSVAPDERDETLNRERVRFIEAAALAGYSLVESQSFTQTEVHSLLSAFSSLGTLSLDVESSATQIFANLLDPQSVESLARVVSESEGISVHLNDFFLRLNRLYEQTKGYLKSNADELVRVKDMASTIEEFFENIRMISLNLSIEASRIGGGSGGKALQVLAQRLRDFSNRAQEISALQRAVIQGAEGVLGQTQGDLNAGFVELEGQVRPIRDRITAFPAIIGRTHAQFDTIVLGLSQLSAAVQSVLKEKLGNLQFQDLTRQEHEHLADLLAHFSHLAPPSPDPAVVHEERLALARDFNHRATTANERRVVLDWMNRHGLAPDQLVVKGSDDKAGSVTLF